MRICSTHHVYRQDVEVDGRLYDYLAKFVLCISYDIVPFMLCVLRLVFLSLAEALHGRSDTGGRGMEINNHYEHLPHKGNIKFCQSHTSYFTNR